MLRLFALIVLLIGLPACGDEELAPPAPRPHPDDDDAGQMQDAGVDAGFDPDGIRPGIDDGEPMPPPPELLEWAELDDPGQLCMGLTHACGLDRDGKALCWGSNDHGATEPPDEARFKQISCGEAFSCGLTVDDEIACWGRADSGQTMAPAGQFKEVAAGGAHVCAITEQDDLLCWGAGNPEQPLYAQPHFGQATPPPGVFHSVIAHQAHSCAVRATDDAIVCWGGGTTDGDCFPPRSWECGQSAPVGGEYVQVALGFAHACGLHADGSVTCWGRGTSDADCDPLNSLGAFYDCGQANPPPGPFKRIVAGFFHTCGIDEGDGMVCWGWDGAGQATPPERGYTQAAAGQQTTCAVTLERDVVCFGAEAGGFTEVPPELP